MAFNKKNLPALIVTAVAAFMVVASGILKLTGAPQIVATMHKVGVGNYISVLAFMEIGFTALFLYPRTMKLGTFLLTAYFAGAIATELSHQGPLQNAALPLVLVWIAAFLRDRTTFLPVAAAAVSA